MQKQMCRKAATTLSLFAALSGPAAAQWVVTDPGNTFQNVQQVIHLKQQLDVMQQQYQQLMQTYRAVSHLPQTALNQLGQQLNTNQFRNALPTQSSALGSLMNGSSLGNGALATAAQGYLNQNRVYSPAGIDFQASELRNNANSVAGAQAMASVMYQSAVNRVTALQGLETLLASAPDTKAVADIQARIASEQAYIQAQQVQAQSLQLWQASQERNREQRSLEERRRQVDDLIEQAKARGG